MWTLPLFQRLFGRLDPERPCALATYSRATLLRTTLLRAGFCVGAGEATGEKEETTLASNALTLIPRPLGNDWLGRALRSTSAEPLENATYRQAPLSEKTRAALLGHSQFRQD
jgi:queuine tRNA-ribosyltransferase